MSAPPEPATALPTSRRQLLASLVRERRPQTLVVGLAFAAMLASGPGQSFVIAVFVDEMLAATDVGRTGFSLLYAGGTVVSAVAMLALGRATDRVGLRVLWAAVCIGLAGACVLASAAHGAALAFVALALLRTFGQGSFPLLATLLVARSFSGRRGQAMASATLGLTAASALLPPVAVWLIVSVGWRDAYRILAAVLLLAVLPLAAMIRPPGKAVDATAGHARSAPVGRYPQALRRGMLRIDLPTRRTRRLLFVFTAPPLLITAVIFHAVSLLAERGLSFTEAGLAIGLFGVANAAGTVVAGAVTDRTQTQRLLTALTGLLVAGTLALLVPLTAAAYAGLLLLGLGGGVFAVTTGIVWPRTYGLAELGRLQGTAWSVQIAAAAVGPLPLAVSKGVTGGYAAALVALSAYGVAALAAALRWRDPRAVRPPRRPLPRSG